MIVITFWVCGPNPAVFPFKRNLFVITSSWHYLFFNISQHEICNFCLTLTLATFGSERVSFLLLSVNSRSELQSELYVVSHAAVFVSSRNVLEKCCVMAQKRLRRKLNFRLKCVSCTKRGKMYYYCSVTRFFIACDWFIENRALIGKCMFAVNQVLRILL